ncbi:MAG: ChbG/HpnK family deacetylase [Gammaproteobacteria bacterium]|nr:ChbG/HpnK family deacetylase [Gammaproteobacteria bacterium]
MTKRVVMCADDFGQSPEISAGIIALIEQQRVTATSCIVTSNHWMQCAPLLKSYKNTVDLGLHFNLTEGQPLTAMPRLAPQGKFPGLKPLILLSSLRQISIAEIEQELTAQIEKFRDTVGCLPDYIDGHQQVHQFPIIRSALLNVYKRFYPDKTAYIRIVRIDKPRTIKEMILRWLGSKELHQLVHAEDIPHNRTFAGVYSLKSTKDFRTLMQKFLAESKTRGIIMCHPGLAGNDEHDEIAETRIKEFAYLASHDFIADCQQAQVELVRLQQCE